MSTGVVATYAEGRRNAIKSVARMIVKRSTVPFKGTKKPETTRVPG